MKMGKFYAGIAILLAGCLFAGCAGKKPSAVAEEKEIEQIFAVNTLVTKPGNLDNYLEFGGDVTSVNSVTVMPDQAGKITNILVTVGDLVKKGQTIAYVNPLRIGAVYNDNPVISPISGRITSLPAQVGATVSQSSPLATVARTDDLEIKINIAERFVSRISNGQKATISFDAYPGVEFAATIFEVSPVLDAVSRTMGVKLRFDREDSRIKVGMYGRVKLVTDSKKNTIVIPSTAVVVRNEKNYVFTADSHEDNKTTVKLVPVTVGITVDDKMEITEGIKAGDEIVVKGMSLLNDGSKVNIVSVVQSEF